VTVKARGPLVLIKIVFLWKTFENENVDEIQTKIKDQF
jgi:hypothetical protein